jgi:hypothetical protein
MTAFLGLPRSLKNASATVFGLEVNKTTRDNMKGKQWGAMTDDFKKEVTEYAVKDSELCLRLWQELSDRWPQAERDISYLNRRVGQRGIPIDTELLKKNLENIRTELFNAEQSIPWISEHTPLSRKAFNEQCRKQGIEPPASIAAGNEDADKWFAAFQDACPWARGVQNYRRINAFLRKLEAFDSGTMPDGRYYGGLRRLTQYQIKYKPDNWQLKKADVGTTFISPIFPDKIYDYKSDDETVINGPLNGSGDKANSGKGPPEILKFDIYSEVNFSTFLRI